MKRKREEIPSRIWINDARVNTIEEKFKSCENFHSGFIYSSEENRRLKKYNNNIRAGPEQPENTNHDERFLCMYLLCI